MRANNLLKWLCSVANYSWAHSSMLSRGCELSPCGGKSEEELLCASQCRFSETPTGQLLDAEYNLLKLSSVGLKTTHYDNMQNAIMCCVR